MHISKGLDIPIKGTSHINVIENRDDVKTVAVIGADYNGMRPQMQVKVGDEVAVGDKLFIDKKNPKVSYNATASGKVISINRGDKRLFLSLVIKVDSLKDKKDRRKKLIEPIDISKHLSNADNKNSDLISDNIKSKMLVSGLWTSLRTRPFSKVPDPDTKPAAVFISTIDTRPLAVDPGIIISKDPQSFALGLKSLHLLTKVDIYLNTAVNQAIPGTDYNFVKHQVWRGKHPAGLVGTHMHFLLPCSISRVNWHINYQDVIALGVLLSTGNLSVERYYGLCGPACASPMIVKSRLGAAMDDLIKDEDIDFECLSKSQKNYIDNSTKKKDRTGVRIISGSVLAGRTASTFPLNFVSRYDNQITLIKEGSERDFFLTKGWLSPGFHKFSILGTYLAKFIPGMNFAMTTSTQGSKRAMVPIGMYEKVMPMDIIATYLLRALIAKDTEGAQNLGALELDEEDLALCTFVCPGKYEYGPILRANLEEIEKNG